MVYKVTPTGAITLNEPDPVKSILQNVSIILRTWQESVPMFREFGMPMQFVDAPVNAALPTMIVEVREAIQKFEPRAELVSVNFSHDISGVLTPEVEVTINESQP